MFLPNPLLTTEFDAPDPALWVARENYLGRLPGVTRPEQIVYHNGMVHLTLALPTPEGLYPAPQLTATVPIRYGRIELLAKLADTRAVQALWLYRWEPEQQKEIDLFEIAPAAPGRSNAIQTNYHLTTTEGTTLLTHEMAPEIASDPRFNPLDWHIYRLDWTPETLSWYVDDYLVRTVTNHPYHEPMYLNLTIEIHQNWLGIPEPQELPATMHIDWIRVWDYYDPYLL